MPVRLKFAHKILILGISLIAITGIGITGANAMQFRAQLYAREFSSAFTVYLAALNYLSAHFKSNRERFVHGSLDYVFGSKFMRVDGEAPQRIKHLPDDLRLYDERGQLVYEYVASGDSRAPAEITPPPGAAAYRQAYLPASRQIRIEGPLTGDGSVPGYVVMLFPSAIQTEVWALYVQSLGVMAMICLGAILLSFLFARRVLQPIENLTRAARRVHEGDLEQRVAVSTGDEIGLLGETFNQMVSSLVRRLALMHRMQEWTVRISKQFEPDQLFGNLVEMFERMTQASFIRLYSADAPAGPLRLQRASGAADAAALPDMAARAHEAGRTLYRNKAGEQCESPDEAVELALPLAIGSKRLGAIHLGPRADAALYEDETLTIVETLAQQAAMAIENANLYTAVAERERVQQEMKWARDIQQTLLPRIMPEIPGYQIHGVSLPASEVGGDYFDVVPSGQNWNCIIGDVSGKGVPAALIMSIVRSLIHTYAEVSGPPEEIVARVNRKLTPDIESEMFVTLAAFAFDPESHRARVVRAGHEPLLLVRANGTVERVQPPGTAMGLTDVPVFDELLAPIDVRFEVGDAVVMFTDGITEARNPAQDELGYERFESWVSRHVADSAHDMVRALVAEVHAFAGGAPALDDITLLVVKRVG
ncbi:MAG TPA: SpoIIE family protein phosphatase [Kiritimatiellia bacterium]|nr:SpoIIE family protein phosphatase [Kiritimatiellia bacterium]